MSPDPTDVDTERANPARVDDYLLGGKDNFAVDREAADAMIAHIPAWPVMARANRDFLRRAVRHLVVDLGVTQFIEVGSGIPTGCNVHRIAQAADPTARVVYIDNDPTVAAHSRALLGSGTTTGRVAFLAADATRPERILADPVLTDTLDLGRPVALLLVSVLMYFDDEVARHIVTTLCAGLAPGSFLTISHPTADFDAEAVAQAVHVARAAGLAYLPRGRAAVDGLFDGLALHEPGVVPMLAWRPDHLDLAGRNLRSVYYWVGMAKKTEQWWK